MEWVPVLMPVLVLIGLIIYSWRTIPVRFKHNRFVRLMKRLERLHLVCEDEDINENWARAENVFRQPIRHYLSRLRRVRNSLLLEADSIAETLCFLASSGKPPDPVLAVAFNDTMRDIFEELER